MGKIIPVERNLTRTLFDEYDPAVRPVKNGDDVINVSFDVMLLRIVDLVSAARRRQVTFTSRSGSGHVRLLRVSIVLSGQGHIRSRPHQVKATSGQGHIRSRSHQVKATSGQGHIRSRPHQVKVTSGQGHIRSRTHQVKVTSGSSHASERSTSQASKQQNVATATQRVLY